MALMLLLQNRFRENMLIDRTDAVFAWKIFFKIIMTQDFKDSPFSPLGCRAISPFLPQLAGKVTAVRALMTKNKAGKL